MLFWGMMMELKIRERPILFSAPMVHAILEGRKTQTRRVVKLPHSNPLGHWEPFLFGGQGCRDSRGLEISGQMTISHTRTGEVIGCPYGKPGDRLYVRETWGVGTRPCPRNGWRDGIEYRADDFGLDEADLLPLWTVTVPDDKDLEDYRGNGWKPSIHMPRWASRIDLEITGVRVERLKSISEADAMAEGIIEYDMGGHGPLFGTGYPDTDPFARDTPVGACAALWDAINGKPKIERDAGGNEIARHRFDWEANPWVWVVEFQRVDQRSKV